MRIKIFLFGWALLIDLLRPCGRGGVFSQFGNFIRIVRAITIAVFSILWHANKWQPFSRHNILFSSAILLNKLSDAVTDSILVHCYYAKVLNALNNSEEAAASLDTAAAIAKNYSSNVPSQLLLKSLAILAPYLQQFYNGVEILRSIITNSPAMAERAVIQGFLLHASGQVEKAISCFERCREMDSRLAILTRSDLQRAHLYSQRGDVINARKAYCDQFMPNQSSYTDYDLTTFIYKCLPKSVVRLKGSVGVIVLSSPTALGHAILDSFHSYNLCHDRFDHLVLLRPPPDDVSEPIKVALEVLSQYMIPVEINQLHLKALNGLELGELTFDNMTFFLHSYWTLNRMVYHSRKDRNNSLSRSRKYLSLPDNIRKTGLDICRENGIDISKPIVVIHTRDHKYHRLQAQAYRNVDINRYIPAIRYLSDNGFLVVRLGDLGMRRINHLVCDIIELPFSPFYTCLLDVFFIANCQFMISCQSGPCSWARAFGKPNLVLNAVYHYTLIPEILDLVAFKSYWSRNANQLTILSCRDILDAGLHLFDNSNHFHERAIELEEMSSEEILAGVKEMTDSLHENIREDTDSQRRFRLILKRYEKSGDINGCNQLYDYIGYSLSECKLADRIASMRDNYLD